MTTKQAIHLLHRLQDEQFDGIHGDERREALSMAVRALESNLVKESGDLVKDLVEDSSSDLISRQETIEYCAGNKTWHDEDRATGDTIYRQDAIDEVINLWADKPFGNPTLVEIKDCIEALPSAQPETHEERTETHACDCISRQAAIDALDGFRCGTKAAWKVIEDLPSAQTEPSQVARDICTILENEQDMRVILKNAQPERKKGKWINHRKDDGHNIADCDQCGNAIQWFDGDEIPRYCCVCGADMRGESDE